MTKDVSNNIEYSYDSFLDNTFPPEHLIYYKIEPNLENDPNVEFLNDYWAYIDFGKKTYQFAIKELVKKYNLKSAYEALSLAKKSGSLKLFGIKPCKKCNSEIILYCRRDLNEYKKSDAVKRDYFLCECKLNEIKIGISSILDNSAKFLPVIFCKKEIVPSKNLTYLEKIYLYCIISNEENRHQNDNIKLDFFDDFLAAENEFSEKIICSLFEKNFLYITNCSELLTEKQKIIEKSLRECENYLETDFILKCKEFASIANESEIKIITPDNKDINSWIIELYESIKNAKLSINDVKELEEYVEHKRLDEIYQLLKMICEIKYIPYKIDFSLEFELMRMLRKYNLLVINYIISYMAGKVAEDLHVTMQSRQYFPNQQKVFLKNKITSYLNYLEASNPPSLFFKKLPNNWIYSDIELFISSNIIGNYKHWETSTTSEIIKDWLDSVSLV